MNICSWLLALENGHAVALYCSDVSCAFDRVCKDWLGAKLRESDLPATVLSFLKYWLEDRVASVVVSDAKSDDQV